MSVVWTQGGLAGCVGQPGSGVTWVCGVAWVWTQGRLAGCVGPWSGLKVG